MLQTAAPRCSTLQSAASWSECRHPWSRAAHRPPPTSRRWRRLAAPAASESPAAPAAPEPPLRLRPGQPSDRALCQQWILREKLNPLSLDPHRFTLAERPRRGPGGGGSPTVVGIGQLKPCGDSALELSSLIVAPEERGRGVGTALVQSLAAQAGGRPLFLTTIASLVPLYRRCGFEEVGPEGEAQVPLLLRTEIAIGGPLAWLVTGQRLILMRLQAQRQQAADSPYR